MQGLIFDIKRYAVHDGPGIRITLFFKGCPLSCWWCHNPESRSEEPEEYTKVDKIGSREFCHTDIIGKKYTVDEVMSIIEKERIFFEESGGGVTFSGGEPLQQMDFLIALLQKCREGHIHTAIDTTGYVSEKNLEKVIPLADLFLYDIKHLDNEKHKAYTGVDNNIILRNFEKIIASGRHIIARIPIIPGINDDAEHMNQLKTYLEERKTDCFQEVNLLPYHKIGTSKYKKFNKENRMTNTPEPSQEYMGQLRKEFEGLGFIVKIGG